jgi:hypothetical protein
MTVTNTTTIVAASSLRLSFLLVLPLVPLSGIPLGTWCPQGSDLVSVPFCPDLVSVHAQLFWSSVTMSMFFAGFLQCLSRQASLAH